MGRLKICSVVLLPALKPACSSSPVHPPKVTEWSALTVVTQMKKEKNGGRINPQISDTNLYHKR